MINSKGIIRWVLIVAGIGTASAAALWIVNGTGAVKTQPASYIMPDKHIQGVFVQNLAPDSVESCMKTLYRFSPDSGSEPAGCLPEDINEDRFERAGVGEGGILLWRQKEEAGDYYIEEPWLLRPGGSGQGISEPDVYLDSKLAWLPCLGMIAMNERKELKILTPAGKVMNSITPDPGYCIIELAVDPENDRIAVLLFPEENMNMTAPSLPVDLAVFSPEGKTLARMINIGGIRHSDGFLQPFALYWLHGGSIAFVRETGTEPSSGESGKLKTLTLADPARGLIEPTDVLTHGIAAVSPKGLILLVEGKIYNPNTRQAVQLTLPSGVYLDKESFSPDGRFFTARRFGDNGILLAGIMSIQDGSWRELGRGATIGWGQDGTLYWVAKPKELPPAN